MGARQPSHTSSAIAPTGATHSERSFGGGSAARPRQVVVAVLARFFALRCDLLLRLALRHLARRSALHRTWRTWRLDSPRLAAVTSAQRESTVCTRRPDERDPSERSNDGACSAVPPPLAIHASTLSVARARRAAAKDCSARGSEEATVTLSPRVRSHHPKRAVLRPGPHQEKITDSISPSSQTGSWP